MQERRTYIPQGWTKFYEFSYGDLKAGTYVMEDMAEAPVGTPIDWETIYGLMEDAIYGGRVDNLYDLRVLREHLSVFFSSVLATDRGVGQEVLLGTPLRMPTVPDMESIRKVSLIRVLMMMYVTIYLCFCVGCCSIARCGCTLCILAP